MNGPFSVGEIVVFRAPPQISDGCIIPNGAECEILKLADHYCVASEETGAPGTIYGYIVAYRHWRVVVEPQYLHRKRPPQVFTGEQRISDLFIPSPVRELESV